MRRPVEGHQASADERADDSADPANTQAGTDSGGSQVRGIVSRGQGVQTSLSSDNAKSGGEYYGEQQRQRDAGLADESDVHTCHGKARGQHRDDPAVLAEGPVLDAGFGPNSRENQIFQYQAMRLGSTRFFGHYNEIDS